MKTEIFEEWSSRFLTLTLQQDQRETAIAISKANEAGKLQLRIRFETL